MRLIKKNSDVISKVKVRYSCLSDSKTYFNVALVWNSFSCNYLETVDNSSFYVSKKLTNLSILAT